MHATRRVQLTDKIIAVYVLIFMFVGAEEDIWALEGWGNRGLEEIV
jgi:hypothetical protein